MRKPALFRAATAREWYANSRK